MKYLRPLSFLLPAIFSATLLISVESQGQLLNRIKNEVKNRVENKVVRETGNAAENTMDKAKDKAVGTAKGSHRARNAAESTTTEVAQVDAAAQSPSKPVAADYKNYDFVPGDKIIFQPDLSGEADAELPARFTLLKGNAEIQSFEEEKILHLDAGGRLTVAPLMDNESYLPEQFTFEFDMMYENPRSDYFASVNDFYVQFYSPDDHNYEGYGLSRFLLHSNERVSLGSNSAGSNLVNDHLKKLLNTNGVWHQVAIYVRKNIAKVYIDGSRVVASNNFPTGAGKLAFRTDGNYGFKIRNVRLAAGGDDKYNKIITEGKFITHGITFDVNKSSIKPESMGALNEVTKLMKDHSDLNFQINGHTDNDGNADANMTLSKARADAVKAKLMEMGVDGGKLTTKGFGATQPIDSNDTQEGKANNRRVEFVKM